MCSVTPWLGELRSDRVRCGDLDVSTEGESPLCCLLWADRVRQFQDRFCDSGLVGVGSFVACFAMARADDLSTGGSPPSAGFFESSSGNFRHGSTRCDAVSKGGIRLGHFGSGMMGFVMDRHGLQTAALGGLSPSAALSGVVLVCRGNSRSNKA